MKRNRRPKGKLASDLGLNEFDTALMEMKSRLYKSAAKAIKKSSRSHEQIAKLVGTSRTRITRIANMGESSLSIEMLSKVIFSLNEKMPIKLAG